MEKINKLLVLAIVLFANIPSYGQLTKGNFDNISRRGNFNPGYNSSAENNLWNEVGGDSTELNNDKIPEGIYAWKNDSRFGIIKLAELDTLHHHFQNECFTEGVTGKYNITGNLGSPRMSRIFSDVRYRPFGSQFIFQHPYDFFITPHGEHLYTNTKSPFTNITYHECGDKEHGEDRIKAMFATNIGKKIGLGFNIDYLYGRGYYQSQNTAHFKGGVYASYIGEKYKAHFLYQMHHLKTSENGGIEDDLYIVEPESFSTTYETWDMPTNLKKTWNKLNVNELVFSQRILIGKNQQILPDSIANDSLNSESVATLNNNQSTCIAPFTLVHSLNFAHNDRLFLSNFRTNENNRTYFNDYFFVGDSAKDKTKNFSISNTIAFELNEGWKEWLKTGARVFVAHEFQHFTLPQTRYTTRSFHYNYINLGAQLMRQKGKYFDFDLLGELRSRDGKKWGEFNLKADFDLHAKLAGDSVHISGYGQMLNETPTFYYRHYQSRNAWWDNEGLDNQTFFRLGADIKYKKINLRINLEQVNDLAYFQEGITLNTNKDAATNANFHSVYSGQNGKPIQRLELTLQNLLTWGIFNWENELTYQTTSDKSLMPLPALNLYSNIFLKFKIAKVLNTEVGTDLRYFTRYTAPVYSPIIGYYVLQDPAHAEKVGGYPLLNVYANFHLKRTRFYIMASHVNASDDKKYAFYLPHMPMNDMLIRFGISWNFIN